MILLLAQEEADGCAQGQILEYLITEDILEKILAWTSQTGDYVDRLKLHQLKLYDSLATQAKQQTLVHKPIIRPLLKLLCSCAEHPNASIEKHVVLLLHQLCICLSKNTPLLELFFDASTDQGPARFLLFSLLVPYVHREGNIGQHARDALLLIMALSSKSDNIGKYIADNSDFCPVLATGLSGLYSSLPQTLGDLSDDWFRITQNNIDNSPDLVMFLNSLEFCNAVTQVAQPMVRDQLLSFIYNGFLVPVIAPALHQNEIVLGDYLDESFEALDDDWLFPHLSPLNRDDSSTESDPDGEDQDIKSSVQEVIAATAYLELFLRRITEPMLMKTFLRFILTAKHDDINILESLTSRINSGSRLCMVSLSLFRTMLELNSEEVMFQLVFKYLVPCNHVMVSQRRSVRDLDIYGKTVEKFLSLKPACCLSEESDNSSLDDSSGSSSMPDSISPGNSSPNRKPKRNFFRRRTSGQTDRSSSPDVRNSPSLSSRGRLDTKTDPYEVSYMEYLQVAHETISNCIKSCQCWSLPYNGENPSPDSLVLDEPPVADLESVSHGTDLSERPGGDHVTAESSDPIGQNPAGVDPAVTGSVQSDSVNLDENNEKSTPSGIDVSCDTDVSSKAALTENADKNGSVTEPAENAVIDTDKSAISDTEGINGQTPECSEQGSGSVQKLTPDANGTDADCTVSAQSNLIDRGSHAKAAPSNLHLTNEFSSKSDLNAFLVFLNHVQTPEDICDNMEDALQSLEVLVNSYTIINKTRTDSESSGTGSSQNEMDKAPSAQTQESCQVNKKNGNNGSLESGICMESSPEERMVNGSDDAHQEALDVTSQPLQKTSGDVVSVTNKYRTGKPDIGPFLMAVFNRLESMMTNSLYVNLLLTGLVSRLACFPQPLIRSFLLNHSLVFQPTVRSLVQVLGSVKHKVDCFSYTVKEFEPLMQKARKFLAWREEVFRCQREGKKNWAKLDSQLSQLEGKNKALTNLAELHQGKKRGSFGNFLFNRNQTSKNQQQLQATGRGYQFMNRHALGENGPEHAEPIKVKNSIYCALVLEEFVKELAAISQEHAVLSFTH